MIAEMTEIVENKRGTYKLVEGDIKRYEESFEFEPVGEETRVTFKIEYGLPIPFLGKLLDIPVVNLVLKRSLKADVQAMLERLKANVERLPSISMN